MSVHFGRIERPGTSLKGLIKIYRLSKIIKSEMDVDLGDYPSGLD
jgi:hypothetical protein